MALTPGVGDVAMARGNPTRRIPFADAEEFERKKQRLDARERALSAYSARLRREGRYQDLQELALLERQIVLKQQLQQRGASESSDLAGK